jgi:hypothetical protein
MRHCLFSLFLLCGVPAQAQAHKPSDSYLSLAVHDQQIDGQWDIALRDLDFAMGLDQDGDGQLTWDEVRRQHKAIAAYALQRLDLSTAKGRCSVAVADQLIDDHSDGAYTVLRFHAECPEPVAALTIAYRLFADLDPQHKGLVRIGYEGEISTAIFGPDDARQTIKLGNPDRWQQFGAYASHGIWHGWIGFDRGVDHTLFLLSLLLPAALATAKSKPSDSLMASLIDVLKVVTAFTLARSVTLTLASLSVISLPSRWVESAIAASVVAAALWLFERAFAVKLPAF